LINVYSGNPIMVDAQGFLQIDNLMLPLAWDKDALSSMLGATRGENATLETSSKHPPAHKQQCALT
jgi:hypothetical protein